MNDLSLRVFIGVVATFITLLFAVFVFSVKSENKLNNRLLFSIKDLKFRNSIAVLSVI